MDFSMWLKYLQLNKDFHEILAKLAIASLNKNDSIEVSEANYLCVWFLNGGISVVLTSRL